MLILTRRFGEKLMIGDDVTITVLSKDRGEIVLGIVAPKEVSVHREEVYLRIKEEENALQGPDEK